MPELAEMPSSAERQLGVGAYVVCRDVKVAPVRHRESTCEHPAAQRSLAQHEYVGDDVVCWRDLAVTVMPCQLEKLKQIEGSRGVRPEQRDHPWLSLLTPGKSADGHAMKSARRARHGAVMDPRSREEPSPVVPFRPEQTNRRHGWW